METAVTLQNKIFPDQKFHPGQVMITQNALTYCENRGIDYQRLAFRHVSGDFGRVGRLESVSLSRAERQHGAYVTNDGLKLNAIAIMIHQGAVFSIYPLEVDGDVTIWIRTDFSGSELRTIILLSKEYDRGAMYEN